MSIRFFKRSKKAKKYVRATVVLVTGQEFTARIDPNYTWRTTSLTADTLHVFVTGNGRRKIVVQGDNIAYIEVKN